MSKQHVFEREDILKCGTGEMFGPEFAKLPLPNMLMVDRVANINDDSGAFGKGSVTAELNIDPDLWFFKCHFRDDPVMPGCLGLDAMWQLTGFFLTWCGHKGKGRALGAGDVKFTGQILPTHKLVTYQIDIKRVIARKLVLAISDATVSVDGKQIYEAKGLKVGLFTSTDEF